MRSKMYEVIIGSLTKTETSGAAPVENYNPDVKHVMVVAKDVADALTKVKLEEGQHVESVARHNFIDVV